MKVEKWRDGLYCVIVVQIIDSLVHNIGMHLLGPGLGAELIEGRGTGHVIKQ